MPIPFTCPHCGTQTSVDDQYAGHTGSCASCGQKITVPGEPPVYRSYARPKKKSAGPVTVLLVGVAVLICGGIPAALLIPARQAAREAARQSICAANLKQIGAAMHAYHDAYNCFPPAVITNQQGTPMRSWRVAIEPYVTDGPPMYDDYNYREPWNSRANQALKGARPNCYACPADSMVGPNDTSYVMIVGEDTIGGVPNECVTFADIRDGSSFTILAVEVAGSGIGWLEPRDMSVDEALVYITNPETSGMSHAHPGGVNVLTADGRVRFVASSISPKTLRAMLTRSDGRVIRDFDSESGPR